MSRLPIRLRVTLAFAAAIAVVLFVVGLVISVRYQDELTASIDRELGSRTTDIVTLLHESDSYNDILPTDRERYAQIVTPSGRVLDTSAQRLGAPSLSPADLRAAANHTVLTQRSRVPGTSGTVRLRGSPARVHGRPLVIVTGEALAERDAAVSSLRTLLLIGGAAALVLASLIGYAAVTASLRPVEAIRRRAAEISVADRGQRLPVPAANDELRRLGRTLNDMLARLEAAVERERSFVDDASHELRTPLAMHRAELEVALRYAAGEEELRAAIASAVEEVARLSQLAEDLLVLARSDKGQLAIKLEDMPVDDVLRRVENRFAARAEAEGRTVEVATNGGLSLRADRLRLEQALGNLVDNALRHGEGPVRLSADRTESFTRLHVTDGGHGFPPQFLQSAFERFSRPDGARTGEGSGLGLAIVEAIAKSHGGSAGAVNRAGGADVWIAIPRDNV